VKIIGSLKAVYLIWKYGPDIMFDGLTNFFGRAIFNVIAEKEIARAKRYNFIFSIVFVDIDNLKEVNDKKGHLEEDEVIIRTARFLESCCRESDSVFKYGGDEFVLILTNTDNVGRKIFEKGLSKRLEENNSFSFSFGGSTWKEGLSIEDIIQASDAKMYLQKEARKKGKR